MIKGCNLHMDGKSNNEGAKVIPSTAFSPKIFSLESFSVLKKIMGQKSIYTYKHKNIIT